VKALFTTALLALVSAVGPCADAITWRHPAGIVTNETIDEIREKVGSRDWAKKVYEGKKTEIKPWLEVSSEDLAAVFPKTRSNVYHNFSCPDDRSKLTFDPFNSREFHCPVCGKTFTPDTDAHIYEPEDRYHGTMYDGWACYFYLRAAGVASDLAVSGLIENNPAPIQRAIELLMLYANTIRNLPIDRKGIPQEARILTYQREGESGVLTDLAQSYELVRDRMTREQREEFERDVIRRMLDDVILDPIYPYDHNNISRYHHAVLQSALALEDESRIDWSFGYGDYSPERQPDHRSIRRVLASHFKPDGAFWEMCSGYHLYPLHALCEVAILSRNISRMDPDRFPADHYDLTHRSNSGGEVIRAALEWFMSIAMPDRTMPTLGDSMAPRAGMAEYYTTAEAGYRFYGVRSIGDYESLRSGQRTWAALLYGALDITKTETAFTSSNLSSGWVSLRNDWKGNRVWAGLNALVPGGGHQHADRLGLVFYSQGQLLALEKATPYNELTTRNLGTFSQSHNTVTVDKVSQKQGETLVGEEIPKVRFFHSDPIVQFAELRGDHLYPQVQVFRRSVALIEDVLVDLFRVEGGQTHDWMIHHAGPPPHFGMSMLPASFEPADWLANGTDHVLKGLGNETWSAQWKVQDVTSRLTMMGAESTEVYGLETYPKDSAVVTKDHPPCQSLCVRRTNSAPYLAVWDAYKEVPNLRGLHLAKGSDTALTFETESHVYRLMFGPGKADFEGSVSLETDAAFFLLRDRDAVTLVGGSQALMRTLGGNLEFHLDPPASLSAQYANGEISFKTSGDIQYDTKSGEDHERETPPVRVRVNGDLWR
jgi:hypothetical protein